ncbi:MAG: hypothetical protein HY820_20210 [Acidobacteria bacterium]|nr:hypothetical protein [Acidobacteriota bacterium]
MAALLGRLVEDYERQVTEGKTKRFTPVERLRYLMEEHQLRQGDLVDVFGTQSVVSEILSGKRSIDKKQARRLSARFHLPMEAFL